MDVRLSWLSVDITAEIVKGDHEVINLFGVELHAGLQTWAPRPWNWWHQNLHKDVAGIDRDKNFDDW
jgi:hypothetical protein